MKSLTKCLLVFVIVSFIAGCSKGVQFSDPNIEAAIRERLNKPKGSITDKDLAKLTTLYAEAKGISDISGVEHCINLQVLHLSDNQIDIISPISNLTKLQWLGLQGNQISDLGPLSELKNLQEVWLNYNQINDISPLSNLTELNDLYINNNQIQDISPLAGLTKIGRLILSNNQISDIQPLVSNSGVGEGDEVDLTGNPLNDDAYDVHIPELRKRGVKLRFDSKP